MHKLDFDITILTKTTKIEKESVIHTHIQS